MPHHQNLASQASHGDSDNHTGVTGGKSCARSWLYEAVLAPMAVRLKTEIAKVPALEFLVNPGGGQVESAVTVRTALFTPKHTW